MVVCASIAGHCESYFCLFLLSSACACIAFHPLSNLKSGKVWDIYKAKGAGGQGFRGKIYLEMGE